MKTIGKTCVALGAIMMLVQGVAVEAQTAQSYKPEVESAETPAPQVGGAASTSSDQAVQDAYNRGRADQAKDDQTTIDRGRSDSANTDQARNEDRSGDNREYDGYCYQRKDQAAAGGAVVGAIAGAAIANGSSNRHDRGENTVAGAIVGAILGAAVGGSSVSCYEGRYYAYDGNYYAPPSPPEGFVTVFYSSRPSRHGYYRHIEHGRW